MDNKNLPAYPVLGYYDNGQFHSGAQTGSTTGWESGLTKREYYSGLAMQAIISKYYNHEGHSIQEVLGMATDAALFADALLSELSKP